MADSIYLPLASRGEQAIRGERRRRARWWSDTKGCVLIDESSHWCPEMLRVGDRQQNGPGGHRVEHRKNGNLRDDRIRTGMIFQFKEV